MSHSPITKAQSVIPTPIPKVSCNTAKTYGNNGMKCVLVDGAYYLQNASGQTIAKKNTLQEIDQEQASY